MSSVTSKSRSYLVFSFDYPPNDGGISRLCAEIARGLRLVNSVRVLTQQQHKHGSDVPCVSEIRVQGKRPWRELIAWWHLIRQRRGELVIAGIWYPEGLLSLLAGRRVVILALGAELMPTRQAWRRKPWAWLRRSVLSRAELVLPISTYTERLVRSSAPASRVRTILLAVDHNWFSPGDRAAAMSRFTVNDLNQRVICSVSRLHSYKGHSTVFRALARLQPDVRHQFVYLIAGRGPDRDALQQEATELGVNDLVRWLGYVAEDDLPDLYRASDLFVLCTQESERSQQVEGFGLVFLEAQACGTPVVGTRTGGIPDAVHDGDGGWLIDADDSSALADILQELASSPETFRVAGAAGRSRVERSCTWDHYLDQFALALTNEGLLHG